MRLANLLSDEFDHASEREGYRWQAARIGRAIGGKQIGASLYELAEGERSHPFHLHHAIEEWLVVVAGNPVLRDKDGERTLRAVTSSASRSARTAPTRFAGRAGS